MQRVNPVRLVAAAVLVIAALARPSLAGLISDVGAIPNPFSPNGDGVYDEIVLRYALAEQAWVVVTVEDSLGAIVRQFWSGEQEPGDHQYVWDGRDDWGALQADGAYTYAINAAGVREVEVVVALDTIPPGIGQLFVAPSRFSPDGDGASDSLHVSFVVDSDEPTDAVSLRVHDASGESVRLLFSGWGVDAVAAFCNGRDDAGAQAPDTLYVVTVRTSDVAHNSASAELLVDLDRNAPALDVAYPDTSLSVVAVAGPDTVLSGWAYDRAGVRLVEVSTDGLAWESADTTPDPLVAGKVAWTYAVACTACTVGPTDETLPVLVRAYDGVATADGLGHVNAATGARPRLDFDVVFDVAPPEHVTSNVVGDDNAYRAGETITIHTKWDSKGYLVEAFFYQIDSEFDPESVDVVDEQVGGLYTITYTISDANAYVFSSPRRVRITASDYFHTVADSSVTVTVEEGGAGSYAITVDENFFDPMRNESARISLGTYSGAVSVSVYNMAGTLVRTIEGSASGEDTAVLWDGTNDGGEVVASGVYFLRIRTDREEQIRKVAVVK
jgi:flagellar hook assembly protein FlgD